MCKSCHTKTDQYPNETGYIIIHQDLTLSLFSQNRTKLIKNWRTSNFKELFLLNRLHYIEISQLWSTWKVTKKSYPSLGAGRFIAIRILAGPVPLIPAHLLYSIFCSAFTNEIVRSSFPYLQTIWILYLFLGSTNAQQNTTDQWETCCKSITTFGVAEAVLSSGVFVTAQTHR